MGRVRKNFFTGTLSSQLLSGATTIMSAALSSFPEVVAPHVAAIVIDPDGATPEVVYITAHTSGATAATVTRGQDSTTDRTWAASTTIIQAPIASDGDVLAGSTITSSNRIPLSISSALDGPTAVASGSSNTVGVTLNPSVSGNFTGITGSDAGSWWGLNNFAYTGTAAGDGAGLTLIQGALCEMAVQAASGTFAVARGFEADVSLFGAAAGATITQAESARISAPKRKAGATGGTIVNAYSLFVEGPTIGTTGNFAVYVESGVSRFGGRLDITDSIYNNGSNALSLYGGFGTNDARFDVRQSGAGGDILARMKATGASFQIFDGTSTNFSISRTGLPKWNAAANEQTTVGAAGGASALPATPTKYLKVVDSGGTTLVIAAYAAS